MILKPLLPCLALSLGVSMTVSVSPALAASSAVVAAETQAAIARGDYPTWWSPTLPEDVQSNVASKAKGLAESLKLEDGAQTQKVTELLSQHFARVWAWHQEVDTVLDAAVKRLAGE